MTDDILLEVSNLQTQFDTESGVIRAVDGISFDVKRGEIVGLVGESGAGKSVATSSILRLVESPGHIVGGEVTFDGKTLVGFEDGTDADGRPIPRDDMLSSEAMREEVRGNEMAVVLQDPMESLNPVFTVGIQLQEIIEVNRGVPSERAKHLAVEMLREVRIPNAEVRFDEYPHEFSGGMRQRVLIAMALACEPSLIIADEPTTALDVTVEGQILNLVADLQERYDTSFIWVTHDLAVVADICDRVNVMYLGEIVEQGLVEELFYETKHPYTQALLNSVPRPDRTIGELDPIEGVMPEAIDPPSGCRFHTRCTKAREVCRLHTPDLREVGESVHPHAASCFRHDEFDAGYWESERIETTGSEFGGKLGRNGKELPTGEPDHVGKSESIRPDDGTLVRVDGLTKYFDATNGLFGGLELDLSGGFPIKRTTSEVRAVDDVSFDIESGETLGLVGESGCGKSTLGRTVLQLINSTAGTVYFQGENIADLGKEALRRTRSNQQMIFQDPQASLNPRMKIGPIVEEPMSEHGMYDESREERTRELLETVGLDPHHYNRYPHQFSGGQRQRINLARALSVDPKFIVCDEPTSALDASIQAQVLNTMRRLQAEFDLTYLFISHDLSVVRHISDRVAVMYLGKIVELADKEELFENPKHPYTKALLSSIPVPDPRQSRRRDVLEGDVPDPVDPPSGCRFRTRCPSLIAPEEYEMDEETWDCVRRFMRAVDRRTFDPDDQTTLYERFFAETTLAGEAATIVKESVKHVLADEWEQARTLLTTEFAERSVCANQQPAYSVDAEEGNSEHFVACHLYADGTAGD